jgi:multiple sugar transport system ATP-binding protein
MTMGSRVAIMHDGVLQQAGRPIDVFRRPANIFVAGFMGEMKMNFVAADLTTSNGSLVARSGEVELTLEHQALALAKDAPAPRIVLGIRPENLSVAADGDAPLKGTVQTFEITGTRALLTVVRPDGELMSAEVPSSPDYEPGMEVALRIDWNHVHVFDAETEQVLGEPHD